MPACPKSEPKSKQKARLQRQKAKEWAKTYEICWYRARGCCQVCGKKVFRPLETDDLRLVGHLHHIRFRSRGGTDDPDNLVLLCYADHQAAHRLRVRTTWP